LDEMESILQDGIPASSIRTQKAASLSLEAKKQYEELRIGHLAAQLDIQINNKCTPNANCLPCFIIQIKPE
jgi:hypothetical protein